MARDAAAGSLRRVRGKGTYRVTVIDKAMNVTYKERSSFQMARSEAGEFMQFRYEAGAGHENSDVYARVVLTDGKTVYESRFCERIRPTGAEAIAHKEFEPGTLQPHVWISGNLAHYYSFVDRLSAGKGETLSLRNENRLNVVTVTKNGAASEFWIDPEKEFHIVRYRLLLETKEAPVVLTDVAREWKKAGGWWYVRRCLVSEKTRQGGEVTQSQDSELVFDQFEPLVDLPRGVFTVDALGLPDRSPIWSGSSREGRTEYVRDSKIDVSAVEKIAGKLPTTLPPK